MEDVPFEIHLPNGIVEHVDIPTISTVIFDIFRAEIVSRIGDFESLEYEDEDGDRISVRTDSDLEVLMHGVQQGSPARVWLGSTGPVIGDFPLLLPEELRHMDIISHGQFGTVYKSIFLPRDRVVAVKCIQLRDDADSRDDILKELHVLGKCCRSEFVVELVGATVDGNTLSIVLEYMDGGGINGYLPLPSCVLSFVSRSVLEGIVFLDSINVMHRDIKPENFVVNAEGFVKLADFGVSKVMECSIADSFVGTSVYMAPERIYGGVYKFESEIWSLGVSILEMALGRFPFLRPAENSGWAPHDVVNRILHEECIIGDDVVEEHGSLFKTMVQNCVQREPPLRWKLSSLVACEYMQSSWPIDRNVVATFVKGKLAG